MSYFSNKSKEQRREENIKAEEARRQREVFFQQKKQQRETAKKRLFLLLAGVLLLIALAVTYSALTPGKYDDFAKCLTEKGAVMYGEDWCQYTKGQKGMFGKSFKYINYQVKTNLARRPTWVIDGKTYETVQSFERLSELTGCKF